MKKITMLLLIFAVLVSGTSYVHVAKSESSDSNFLAWGFKKNPGKSPEVTQETKDILARNGGVYIGNESEKKLYLTFDCGYEKGYTPKILDVLKEQSVTATFFVTGQFLSENTDLISRMVNENHLVGNHTVHHIVMPKSSDEKNRTEMEELKKKFHEIVGANVPMDFMRPPKGEYNARTLALAKELGYTTAFWSSAYVDWTDDKLGDLEYAYKAITGQFHNGSVILLHNTAKNNADVLERVILAAKEQGYEFASLNELKK